MNSLLNTPLDQTLSDAWKQFDPAYKRAFFIVIGISLLAFGFEMTNLILHHDDLYQIFIQDTILGHYLGRFGVGRLHYYTQNAYIMPFLQMAEGIVFTAGYGLVMARFWGARRTLDIALIASIVCVFPFMAQVYQYNTSMATYSLAHLLVALAVMLSTRATIIHVALAAVLYTAAFSIYQSVIANAATIFLFWVLAGILFGDEREIPLSRAVTKSTLAALAAAGAGGIIYLAAVSSMHLKFDSSQAAGQAFSLGHKLNLSYLSYALTEILHGTRSFFLWPESYFPNYLKKLQLVLLVSAFALCLWLPKGAIKKVGAVAILALSLFAPRMLQFLHAGGHYHNLTLTAYAVVVAGSVMIINRAASVLARNAAILLVSFLLAGYILQCNWISTVNYLNDRAHFNTLTQILARIRSVPDIQWDGKKVTVVGSYNMPSAYPFKPATGVASQYMDAVRMQYLARLMRDEITFVAADQTTPKALEYAATHAPWPHPNSFGIVDGIGVLVLSKEPAKAGEQPEQ
ncbi:MAG TPA: glucosyltransferase domain-containing protein [Gammaproteobacteria bacterium]|nr:glucosyltransferase domain-containing protein [Gammaproteobacteria bacterium]